MLLYLHGFNSAPSSTKAQQVAAYWEQHFAEPVAIPTLAVDPRSAFDTAFALAQETLERGQPLRLIGSSMGGFLATHLLETLQPKYPQAVIQAVLINPAVTPWLLIPQWVGEHLNPYTGESFTVLPQFAEVLQQWAHPSPRYPGHYWVLVQSGDEVLDYREAVVQYQCCRLQVTAGGDHSYPDFAQQLPAISHFFGLS